MKGRVVLLAIGALAVACGGGDPIDVSGSGVGGASAAREGAHTGGVGGGGQASECTIVDERTASIPFTACTGDDCEGLEQAVAHRVDQDCGRLGFSSELWLRSGCGLVTVSYGNRISGGSSTFDAETGVLVGYSTYSDVRWGPCRRHMYVSGNAFPICDEERTCALCDGSRGDSGAASPVVKSACP
jgi:hypothetical protein